MGNKNRVQQQEVRAGSKRASTCFTAAFIRDHAQVGQCLKGYWLKEQKKLPKHWQSGNFPLLKVFRALLPDTFSLQSRQCGISVIALTTYYGLQLFSDHRDLSVNYVENNSRPMSVSNSLSLTSYCHVLEAQGIKLLESTCTS